MEVELKRKPVVKRGKKAAANKGSAHDEKRLDIITACADLFDRVGYHGMSMQALADAIGLGKPTLYHYFASKADILFEMHQIHIDALIASLNAQAAKSSEPSVLLTQACADTLREIAEHPGYVRAFMDHYGELEGEHRIQIRNRRREYYAGIKAIISDGIASGKFRKTDPDLAVLAFLGMCNWAYKWYPPMADKTPPERMAKQLCQVFLEGLNRPAK